MDIAEQFSELDMSSLIGESLQAVVESQTTLSSSMADFIKNVGFDEKGNAQTVSFQYERPVVNKDQGIDVERMKINAPMLSIVPIPNLQVDNVDVIFNMEVHETVRNEEKAVASITGFTEPSGFKVNISGAVPHVNKSDSNKPQAKYHIHVKAKNNEPPKELTKILEIMSDTIDMKQK